MKHVLKAALTILVAVSPWVAQASTLVFSDNFDANTIGLNKVPAGWSISNGGTVDIVSSAYLLPCFGGGGTCVDLNGSSSKPGNLFSPTFSLTANQAYSATFELAGNARLIQTDTVSVLFGTTTASFSRTRTNPFSLETVYFTPTTTGNYTLSFLDSNNLSNLDDVGALLDNVSVQAVPEPATYAMLLLGLGFIGIGTRRKLAVATTSGVTRRGARAK